MKVFEIIVKCKIFINIILYYTHFFPIFQGGLVVPSPTTFDHDIVVYRYTILYTFMHIFKNI